MVKFNTVEEQNEYLKNEGVAGYDKSFALTFRDRKKVFFEVYYGQLGQKNQNPYFATSAGMLNYRRTDWDICGQGQKGLLKNRLLKKFFEKWDEKHLKMLTLDEFAELESDIEVLKESIPYIKTDRFYAIVEFDRELS